MGSRTWVYNGVAWEAVGGGNVAAASPFSADNRLLRSDGTGKAIQDSGIALDDTTFAMYPATNDVGTLGKGGNAWGDLFLANGAVINFDAGDVTITHSANTLAFAGASTAYTFADGPVRPATNDGAALGVSGTAWSDLFLASGAVINWNAGDVTLTHSSNLLAMAGGVFVVQASNASNQNAFDIDPAIVVQPASGATNIGSAITLMSNGSNAALNSFGALSLEQDNTDYRSLLCLTFTGDDGSDTGQGFAVRGYDFSTLKTFLWIDAGGNLNPGANNTYSLGKSGTAWADLFLASGAVINFNNGDVTITHSSNLLTVGGGGFLVSSDGGGTASTLGTNGVIGAYHATLDAHIMLHTFGANRGGIACDGSGIYLTTESTRDVIFKHSITALGDHTATGTEFARFSQSTASFRPGTNAGLILGVNGTAWGGLYLSSGAGIDFASGDITLTHQSNNLVLAGGTFQVGTNRILFADINHSIGYDATGSIDGPHIRGWQGVKFTSVIGGDVMEAYITNTGMVIGTPTGGLKGRGTLNATAVYDDNTLLTDYVFDHWQDGALNPGDADNARALAFDPAMLDIDTFTASCVERRALPAMLRRAEWTEETRFSLGELAQRLWETVEIQAVHIAKLNERLKTIEGRH